MNKKCVVPGALAGLWLAALGSESAGAEAAAGPDWPDTYLARVEALAVLQSLNAQLLSEDSATATLERWCSVHKLAPAPHMVAVRVPGTSKAPSDEQRLALHVGPTETVRYRHVHLVCGSLVLSDAENWYVPARLSAQMNHRLEDTDAPFGVVVRELHFQRHTLAARLLWMPLPEGWEMGQGEPAPGTATLPIPGQVLEHRAVLTLPDGQPFSEVVETYTGNVLAFPAPQAPSNGR